MTLYTNDLRCVSCDRETVLAATDAGLVCRCCGADYANVWGVPFIGSYEAEDVLGLIEIAANSRNRGNFGLSPEVVESWEKMLSEYHDACDKEAYCKSQDDQHRQWLQHRYGEWLEVNHLSSDIQLKGMDVLDIGAGLGFDSHRLAMRGANVTALEFSPLLAEAGKAHFPHIRWIGGFSHVLPFKSGSFDAVFCNAALHHMRDIPAALSEALRVLRPGGYLITTCDSFCPSHAKEDAELSIFDAEPSVLLGVNERVPRFSEFVETLVRHSEVLEVQLFTHTLYNAPFHGTLTSLTPWDFTKDRTMLETRSGSLAMRIRLKSAWQEQANRQHGSLLAPRQYADWLASGSSAVSRLAPLIPTHYLDLAFPGEGGSKFEMLNGWRLPRPFQYARTGYRRGRWFLRRPADADTLAFEIGLPHGLGGAPSGFQVLLDGKTIDEFVLALDAWMPVNVDVAHINPGQAFAIEIIKSEGDDSLDGAAFVARDRRFVRACTSDPQRTAPTVYAVIPVYNRLQYTLSCIAFLQAQDYVSLHIIVSDGGSNDGTVDVVRNVFPDVTVLTSKQELWWAGSMAAGVIHAISESTHDEDCLLMMNNDTEIPVNYVSTLVSASQRFNAAVGSLIVDRNDTTRILDAGEYVSWPTYSFPVKNSIERSELFRDDVDFLPGRGTLIPLWMILQAGNVDAINFPHYLADYEYFYRLKSAGFRLGVCYETRLLALIQETGIVPGAGVTDFRSVLRELFARASMGNVIDHWRFVSRHAPTRYRVLIHIRIIFGALKQLLLRTQLRPAFLPLYYCVHFIKNQIQSFYRLPSNLRAHRMQIVCNPHLFPSLVRLPIYMIFCPGLLRSRDFDRLRVSPGDLVAKGLVKECSLPGWYQFVRISWDELSSQPVLRALFIRAWNPILKPTRLLLVWRMRNRTQP
ncbi:methyltransferase domain-containing protein [Cyanobium sp. N5-Cardenillas]|uniref:methyltransferase domain-containing protein n=1 Tax=Cyanobium sp. N5-Cardenillas TaxID=2823720 RepID=UPI0020CC8D6A|nr:methyltransferase domain-containing protein [Cyanobium sp. N5-Cardenillas]MCP9784753.1 methyltransferase domain-containing protein [Cyanobium sp. N5-Cardenillas]